MIADQGELRVNFKIELENVLYSNKQNVAKRVRVQTIYNWAG